MMIFLDSAHVEEITELASTGLIDGITTNPSLVAASGVNLEDLILQLTKIVKGSISAEVVALEAEGMITQGRKLAKLGDNVTIKVPLTPEGLKACKVLSSEEIMVNVTLCFSLNQALLAAKAGATFVSPFVGRLDDCGADGGQLIRDIKETYERYSFETLVLAASLRHANHVYTVAKMGVDVITIPAQVFRQLYHHPLTDLGLDTFMKDWKKSGLKV